MSGINYDLKKIKGFVFDVDGVLSPSLVPMNQDGRPMQMANLKDGYAIQLAAKLGFQLAIITGNDSEAVRKRFLGLGVQNVYSRVAHKIGTFKQWLAEQNLDPAEVTYMGDDIPDLDCLALAGLPCAPADAAIDVRQAAKYISPYQGGHGCARDLIEQTLRAQGLWLSPEHAFHW